jgi:hypothetical protein
MTRLARLMPALVGASLVVACSGSSEDAPPSNADTSDEMPASAPLAPAGGEGSQPSGLPGSFGPPECDACLADRCSDAVAACTADAACSRLLSCVTDCAGQDDPGTCFGGCELAASEPPEELDAFFLCLAEQCEAECSDVL